MIRSKYPIIAAPMNQVSDLNFAVAVHHAGATPSIFSYCYDTTEKFMYDVMKFIDITGSNNLIIALSDRGLLQTVSTNFLSKTKISYVMRYKNETLPAHERNELHKNANLLLKDLNIKQICIHEVEDDNSKIYYLKGSDGAGRPGIATTKELFDLNKKLFPNISFIPSGGIGTSEQVSYYIKNGAYAVGIGTLLAASEESCLSKGTKEKLIESTSKDLVRLDSVFNQQALVFNQDVTNDDINHTESLKQGIYNHGTKGHIFVGKSIDYITKIKPLKEIILDLSKDL